VGDKLVLELLEGPDDSLEGGSDIGEIGNTTSDNEDLSLRVRSTTGDQIN
jgi:hypothetical protein